MQPTYIIAPPNPGKIIGRVDLLAKIHSELQSGQPVALVHGIGGIGKTTVAAAYAHHPEYLVDYDAICWLEVVQDLPRAFASAGALQRFLGVEELVTQTLLTPQPDPETPREVYALMHIVEALQRCQHHLLLLLDNANEEQELRRFIPVLKEATSLRILVTSRADCDDLNPIAVEALPPDEAAALFWRHFEPTRPTAQSRRTDPEDSEVYDLIASFDHHTLLVEMLGKIGREAGYTLPEVLRHVRELTLREEKWQIPVGTGQSGRTHRMNKQTLKTYLAHLFREIKNLSEEDTGLLRRICVLPNRGYSTEQIAKLLALEDDAIFELRKQLATLDQRGIPLQDANQRGYWRLHPLFREVCLSQFGPFTTENTAPLTSVVGKMVAINYETRNWQEQFENREFAEELLRFMEGDKHSDIVTLKNRVSWLLYHLGLYQQALPIVEESLALQIEISGEVDSLVGTCHSHLGLILKELYEFKEAQIHLQKSLKIQVDLLGASHPEVSNCRSNLATVLYALKDLDGARTQLEMALASDLESYGENHPNVALRRSNLASVFQDLGDLEGAKKQLKMALSSDLDNFGEKHPNVARVKNNLAYVLESLNEKENSIDLWKEALDIWQSVLPKEHPYVLSVERALRKRGVEQ
ncbi:MAG: tetratricopeptide repeat protein [Saprospiraceae bacterium]|nr:tetratricopeptide repeat protein [Saprospiraceae bacterium]